MSLTINICKLHADATVPVYATEGAAGFDLVAVEDVIIPPGETKLIRTGLAFEIPQGYEMQIRPRSGISLRTKLRIANAPGTIDSDYRGEVGVIVENTHSGRYPDGAVRRYGFHVDGSPARGKFTDGSPIRYGSYIIRAGDRIAQAVIAPVVRANFVEAGELTVTKRGAGGFGSTGTSAVLAVESGACPFPDDCDLRFTCVKSSCHYDTCDNGFAYRRS